MVMSHTSSQLHPGAPLPRSGEGAKTVIPAKCTGKFSLRLVPDMDPAKVMELVRAHVEAEFSKLHSPNKMELTFGHSAAAWLGDVDSPNFVAARRATVAVHGVEPDLTREGGSIPITLTFEEVTGKSVLLLPIGGSDDGAHSTNEKINVSNVIAGIKLLGTYLVELGAMPRAA